MLSAARAQGRPMIVIAMMTAAISQPAAIHTPPKTNQRTLRSKAIEFTLFVPHDRGRPPIWCRVPIFAPPHFRRRIARFARTVAVALARAGGGREPGKASTVHLL